MAEISKPMAWNSEGSVGASINRRQVSLFDPRHRSLHNLIHSRPSMLPTLNLTGDVILAEHLSHRFGKIGLGDIVLVRSPTDPTRMVTKRILGLEGHRLSFSADPLVGDGSVSVVVPKGHVWIQGDNLYASTDSRNFGPVPYSLIEGKALLRVWPPRFFGSLR
ncbi:mitochondrial inner membrane protease subunit 1 isoform X2 [Brassica rapa]|uniref:mitochondrial inner membrane protease subunit 1 isoform X2 n=1 Tax=Brassica campestris TaxID=3711 RepID=UPI0004F1A26F|nr:mitochondrial inner membrane protease subunit 1 isoform X2 [Brassica rapa]XP_009121998.1 mitochondrial inner membrane protease subunit 1 isoform X2 [Brassica rapa]XP_013668096.1 mitochondrial inner membrane protease subunit 1 isoform X2 [Brassica napus]XP_013668097.1 mitochondrial inner membrane protease subunit 1 isoform X2 [Brassica napus]